MYFDILMFNCIWENEPSVFVLFTDISNQIRKDRLEKLHKFKSEIIANMNHNLKTPLNGISLYLDILNNKISEKDMEFRDLIGETKKN